MDVDTKRTNVSVEIELEPIEVFALGDDGEVLAHTEDGVVNIAILKRGCGKYKEYKEKDGVKTASVSKSTLYDLCRGDR